MALKGQRRGSSERGEKGEGAAVERLIRDIKISCYRVQNSLSLALIKSHPALLPPSSLLNLPRYIHL